MIMIRMKTWIGIILFLAGSAKAQQPTMDLTLTQAIGIAQENSPEAQAARHTYRSAYWNYRYYKANYLPSGCVILLIRSLNVGFEVRVTDGR